MIARDQDADDPDEDVEGWDDPDEDDDTVPCPHCGDSVFDDAERCPSCGLYLSREDTPRESKPWWVVLGVLACLGMVTWWILHP